MTPSVDKIMDVEGTPRECDRSVVIESLAATYQLAQRLTAILCGYVAVHGYTDTAADVLRQAREARIVTPLVRQP